MRTPYSAGDSRAEYAREIHDDEADAAADEIRAAPRPDWRYGPLWKKQSADCWIVQHDVDVDAPNMIEMTCLDADLCRAPRTVAWFDSWHELRAFLDAEGFDVGPRRLPQPAQSWWILRAAPRPRPSVSDLEKDGAA